jgi:hypothetical protein
MNEVVPPVLERPVDQDKVRRGDVGVAPMPRLIAGGGDDGDAGGVGGGGVGGGGRCRLRAATWRTIALVAAAAFAGLRASPYLPPMPSLPGMVLALCAIVAVAASALNRFGCASMPHTSLVGALLEPTPPAVLVKLGEDPIKRTWRRSSSTWKLTTPRPHPY